MKDKFHIDSHKLHLHPHRVAQLLDGRDDWEKAKEIYPLYIEVSPVGACMHQCKMCGVDYVLAENLEKSKIPQLDADNLIERFAEMGSCGVKSLMFAGAGEPLLHRRINSIVNGAFRSGLDVAFTTNAVLLNKLDLHGISWVKISLNGATPESYAKVHQTKESDFHRVIANIKDAMTRKGACTIGIQMVLLPENQNDVAAFNAIKDDLGLDYAVIKPFSQHRFSINKQYAGFDPKSIPIIDAPNLIVRRSAMDAVTEEIPYSKCLATPFTWAYIEADGSLYSCSAYLLDDRFNLGNLNTHSFREVWQGEKRKANWEFVRNGLDIHECRQSCRMDKANRYLTELVEGAPHRNFI